MQLTVEWAGAIECFGPPQLVRGMALSRQATFLGVSKSGRRTMTTTVATDVLSKELETFKKLMDSLLVDAEGKYALIHKDVLHGTYAYEYDAIQIGYKQFGNVPFLVKKISAVETPVNFASNTLGLTDAG